MSVQAIVEFVETSDPNTADREQKNNFHEPQRQSSVWSRFRFVDHMDLRKLVQALLRELDAKTGLLGAAERHRRSKIEMLVHPYRARLHA